MAKYPEPAQPKSSGVPFEERYRMFRDEHTHPPRLSDDEKRTLFRQQPATPPRA